MRQVYRMTLRIGEFNDMLLQNFEETVIKDPSEATVTPINSRWQARNNHLELIHPMGSNDIHLHCWKPLYCSRRILSSAVTRVDHAPDVYS